MTDVLIIGGGHNGLVCAAYLARAGKKVTVLEAAQQVGGLAATREFAPGFRASCAHLQYLLDDSIARELALEQHGLVVAASGLATVALDRAGHHLVLTEDHAQGQGLADADVSAYREYRRRMTRFAGFIGHLHNLVPPRITDRPGDLLQLAKLALRARLMGRDDLREFLRIAGINIHDVLEEHFEDSRLKGALALDAVLGTFSGPRSNNTVFTGLHRMSGKSAGVPSIPAGGMGAVSEAMAAAATAAGAKLRTGARVERILVEGLEVRGVKLQGGEQILSKTVISNADPRTTMLDLLGARHMEAEYARRFNNFRSKGNAAKLHLALDGLPGFTGLERAALGQRLLISPSLEAIDQAFNPCKYGDCSERPVMEITLPSLHDPGLAPEGQHVLSAVVQYAPFELNGGWEAGGAVFLETVLDTLAEYAPDIRKRVLAAELLSPADIEETFGVAGGHWHHGELSLDQFLMLRPVPRAAQYRMPVNGLFLCGAGCHPGGGVMGSAGRNAANAVLTEEKKAGR